MTLIPKPVVETLNRPVVVFPTTRDGVAAAPALDVRIIPDAVMAVAEAVPVNVGDAIPAFVQATPSGIVTVPVKVGEARGAKAVDEKALEPRVPPVPMLSVEPSVPVKVSELFKVNVLPLSMAKVPPPVTNLPRVPLKNAASAPPKIV